MIHSRKDQSRIGRPAYWLYYGMITVLSLAMYGWGIYEVLALKLFPIVFGFVAPFILGIYLRVIAMRRCRDIGWPSFLPWLALGMATGLGALGGLQTVLLHGAGFHASAWLMAVSMLLGGADFIFLIVIGCVPGRGDGSNLPSGRSGPRDPMPAAPNAALADQWPLSMHGAVSGGHAQHSSSRSSGPGFGRKGL